MPQDRFERLMSAYCVDRNPSRTTKAYEIYQLLGADRMIGLKDQRVLEVGGALPADLVLGEIGAKSWMALEAYDWNQLTNTATPDCRRMADLSPGETLPPHLQVDGFVEDLPEFLYGSFDRVISIAAFEHINHFPRALERMFQALRPGGKLYAFVGPIWSAFNGHHLTTIHDKSGRMFRFDTDDIPPWGHLLFTPPEMYDFLRTLTDAETADRIVHEVYHSPSINRLFAEDYAGFVESSGFKAIAVQGSALSSPPPELLARLRTLHPRYKAFEPQCLLMVLEKPVAQPTKVLPMSEPLVTVAMPLCNDSTHFDAAFDALLAQTYPNIEIVICDDASTDGSYEKAAARAAGHAHVRVLQNDVNIGVTGNFNRLRGIAEGKYVMLQSANDTIAPTLIETAVAYLEAHPECGLVTSKVINIDERGLFHSLPARECYYSTMGMSNEQSFLSVVANFNLGDVNYGLIRREILRKVQPYRWCGGPDHVFIAEVALYSRIHCLPEYLRYRRLPDVEPKDDRNHLSIRRVHRGRKLGCAVADVFLGMKFLHMSYEHVQMLHESDLEETHKSPLSALCLDVLRHRFGQAMEAELDALAFGIGGLLRAARMSRRRGEFSAYERLQVEEYMRALAMAQLIYPDDESLGMLRREILEILEPMPKPEAAVAEPSEAS